jgi:hypothetical protein
MRPWLALLSLCLWLPARGIAQEEPVPTGIYALGAHEVEKALARYAPAELSPDVSTLPAKAMKVLGTLIKASHEIDRIYWDQVSSDGRKTYEQLLAVDGLWAKLLGRLLSINYGPWDRFRENEAFVGHRFKPAGGNFYPEDLSAMQLERWIVDHPQDRAAFLSPYTVIRRTDSKLIAVPYHKEYFERLQRAADLLKEAAGLCDCRSLQKFLEKRAVDLLVDDFFKSELLWMSTDSCPLEVVFGPYETYEDQLMGLKTAYEAIIAVRDEEATRFVGELARHSDEIVKDLPLKGEIRDHLKPAPTSAVTVADVAFTAGDARSRFQISAFSLPNDERVRAERGSKNVILRNVVNAKYKHVLWPIAQRVLTPAQSDKVPAKAYFDLILMWNLAQRLGPPVIVMPDGHELDMRTRLKERFNIMDLVRSDSLSLANAFHLAANGHIPKGDAEAVASAYLASVFMNIRYGAASSHGFTKSITYNYFMAEGAFQYDPKAQKFTVVPDKLATAARMLAAEVLTIQALGDYERAGNLILKYGILPSEVKETLARLADVPVDITPVYSLDQK